MRSNVWLCALASVACGDVKHSADGGGGGGGDFTLSVAPASAFLRQAGSVEVEVTIDRQGFAGDIAIAADGLPDGVSPQPLTIADGEPAGTLTLDAAGDAAQGEAAVTITGEAADGSGSGELRLLVGGAPGSFDLGFAAGGKLVSNFDIAIVAQRGITLQPDGKIVGTGSSGDQAITYRLRPDGSIDDGFGTDGVVTTGLGESTGGLVPLVLADGRIVVAGWGGPLSPGYDSALFGYTAAGQLDGDFGSSGTVSIDLGAEFDEFHALVQDPDGGLLPAAIDFTGGTSSLRRYDAQGILDDGYVVTPAASAGVQAAIMQGDGKTVLAGSSAGDFWLERRLAGGELDDGFDGDGTATTDMGSAGDRGLGIVALAGGKVAVGGLSGGRIAIARYNGNGSLDLTFGDGGKLVTDIELDSRGLNAMAVDSQGRFVIVGFVLGPPRLPAVVRLTPAGEPDDTFGDGGLVALDLGIESSNQTTAFGVVIDADDRVIVSCDVGAPGAQQAGIVRLWP